MSEEQKGGEAAAAGDPAAAGGKPQNLSYKYKRIRKESNCCL